MANDLVLGLMNTRGCTKEQAKKIFKLVRDSGYQLEKAYAEVMGEPALNVPEFAKIVKKEVEALPPVEEVIDAKEEEKALPVHEDAPAPKKKKEKAKPKAKSKRKKK